VLRLLPRQLAIAHAGPGLGDRVSAHAADASRLADLLPLCLHLATDRSHMRPALPLVLRTLAAHGRDAALVGKLLSCLRRLRVGSEWVPREPATTAAVGSVLLSALRTCGDSSEVVATAFACVSNLAATEPPPEVLAVASVDPAAPDLLTLISSLGMRHLGRCLLIWPAWLSCRRWPPLLLAAAVGCCC
jgi:hypothetical protein